MDSFIFLTEKKDERVKARTGTNESSQQEYTKHDNAASSMALTASHIITVMIDTKQHRKVMTADIPNAFVQMDIERKNKSKQTIIKIRKLCVDMLVNIAPQAKTSFMLKESTRYCMWRC
jgi:hypothetical protein